MNRIKRFSQLALASVFGAGLLIQLLPGQASAAQITGRALTLQANGTTGGSLAGGTVNHRFSFTLPTSGTLGSIKIEYCTTAANSTATPACVAPTGISLQSAAFGGNNSSPTVAFSSFTSDNGVAPYNVGHVSRTANSIGGAADFTLTSVVNPSTANQTFFVRLTSYASTDTTGSPVDTGTVAASTANAITLSGTMPESLVFCTGGTVTKTGGVPDCSTATSGAISFNQLFSPTDTAYTTSQMAASTNAGSGYTITVNGAALTSGANTIPGYATTSTGDLSLHGVSNFGLNLKQNTTSGSLSSATGPNFGSEIDTTSNGTSLRGNPQTGYASADHYRFVTGESVAKSDNGGLGGTDAQIYTASYIANAAGNLPAGTYTTTLTYICTPTF